MAWPKGRKRGVEQGNSSQTDEHEHDTYPQIAPEGFEAFSEWAQRYKLPVVLVSMSHPDATDRHIDGAFSGYVQKKGPVAAAWSDGSSYPEK